MLGDGGGAGVGEGEGGGAGLGKYAPLATRSTHSSQPPQSLNDPPGAQCSAQSQWHQEVQCSPCAGTSHSGSRATAARSITRFCSSYAPAATGLEGSNAM